MKMKCQFDRTLMVQKLFGAFLLALSVLIVSITMNGDTPALRDGTALVILVPAGLMFLLTRKKILNLK